MNRTVRKGIVLVAMVYTCTCVGALVGRHFDSHMLSAFVGMVALELFAYFLTQHLKGSRRGR